MTGRSGSPERITPGRVGAALDTDALGELHELYLSCGLRERDETGDRLSVEPGYRPRSW
jgi:glucarate dehydratase